MGYAHDDPVLVVQSITGYVQNVNYVQTLCETGAKLHELHFYSLFMQLFTFNIEVKMEILVSGLETICAFFKTICCFPVF